MAEIWRIGDYQAWDFEGNNCDVSLRVHKSENNYYLEASSYGEVLSDFMLSSPYCGFGGIVVDESDMAGNFTISESFNGGNYLTFITGKYEGGYTYVGDAVIIDDMFRYYKVSVGD